MVFSFDGFTLDEEKRELRQAATVIEMQPKVMDLLLYLVKHREHLVTREELLDAVWDGVVVGDAAISRAIREVRRAVGDDGDAQRIVKTAHARGFRFVAEVTELPASAGTPAQIPAAARPAQSAPVVIASEAAPDDDFVGRKDAVALVQKLLRDVANGTGRSLVLVGEPGIGKSALLAHAVTLAAKNGISAHVARCTEADGVPALWPWEELVRSIRDGSLYASTALESALSEIAPLLGREVAPLPDATDDATTRFRLQMGCVRFVLEAARLRPVVLLFDDVHLADSASLAVLCRLAPMLRSAPVGVIVTMRDAVEGQVGLSRAIDALSRAAAPGVLSLRGLENEEIAELVSHLVGQPPAPEVADSLRRLTGGNPLFVSHLISLTPSGEAPAESTRLPRVLKDAVDAALERMSPSALDLLTTGAVVGGDFRLVVLAKALGAQPDHLLDAIGEAADGRIIRRVQKRVDTFEFVHGIVRDSLYLRLGHAERARRHAAVGDALLSVYGASKDEHAEELAHHFLRAASAGRADLAVTFASLAGEHAVWRSSFEHAATFYRAALDAMPLGSDTARERGKILMRLGSALGRDGRIREASEAFKEAARDGIAASEPVTAPFVRDVQTLRESFESIVGRVPEVTTRFYEMLFASHPHLRALFKRNSGPVQAKMMNDTLLAIIDRLEDAPWLRASLAAFGARHVEYDVTEDMYPMVGKSLLAALEEAAGPAIWRGAVPGAWAQAFDAISAMMIDGARAATRRAG